MNLHPFPYPAIHPTFLPFSKKTYRVDATFFQYRLLYIKPVFLALTVTIPSAEALVKQCIEGDISAYRLLYDRYSKAMFNTALRITANRNDAEDVLQESFTDAFMQLRSFESKSTFGAWLKQIVVFKSISFLKKRKINFLELDTTTTVVVEEHETSETEIEYSVAGIKRAIGELADGYRTVLSLYLLEGYDHGEIAEIMQVTPSTVRTQYKRGKQRLLQLLEKEDVHE